jgi:hypothetical protein
MSFPDESQVDTVAAITGFCDRAIIANALQASSYNVESVINEYFDSADKVGSLRLVSVVRSSCADLFKV